MDSSLRRDVIPMRAPLARIVRKEFTAQLTSAAPQFVETKGENIPAGDRLYVWEVLPTLRFYLLLQFHQYEDWFTLEVGVSRSGRWPAYALMPTEPLSKAQRDHRFRIGRLWAPAQQDVWWELAPRPAAGGSLEEYNRRPEVDVLLPKIRPLAEDATRRLRDYAIPWLKRIAIEAGAQIA